MTEQEWTASTDLAEMLRFQPGSKTQLKHLLMGIQWPDERLEAAGMALQRLCLRHLSSQDLVEVTASILDLCGSLDAKNRWRVASVIRCVMPYSQRGFSSKWRTSDVVGLASEALRFRAYDRMPILADALEEAGCQNWLVLEHCRRDALHSRLCWVINSILGKK